MKRMLAGTLIACLAAALATSAEGAEGATPPLPAAPQAAPAPAAEPPAEEAFISERDCLAERFPFACGEKTFQFVTGYFGRGGFGAHGAIIDYASQEIRFGILCNDPHYSWHWFSGVFEALLACDYAAVTTQNGNYFTGPSALLRYNYVRPHCALVPYLQGGVGFVFNDLYHSSSDQQLIGQAFEFRLQASAGAHWMVTDTFSLDAELGLQHISNAGLAAHNGGLNNVGASVGFTFYFGK